MPQKYYFLKNKKTKLNFKFGIGTNASDYKDLKLSYRNAKEILKISDVFSTSESVFEYEKMDLELLFMNLKKSNIETFKKKCLKDFSLKEIKEFSVILSVL